MRTRRLSLADVVRQHARGRGDALAVVDGAVRLSWADLDGRTNRAAQLLAAAGVGRGDRVLWLGQNSFRLVEVLVASAKLGAACCPVNWRQSGGELAFVIDDLAPTVVLWQHEEIGAAVDAGRRQAARSGAATWIGHDDPGPAGYEARLAGAPDQDPDRDATEDAPLLLIYTAAFGGRPAAAMLPSGALVAQGLLMAPYQGFDDATVYLVAGPLFHLGTWMAYLSVLVSGGTGVFIRRSDGSAVAAAIASERCTSGFVVGPMVDAVVAANAAGAYDLSSFRGRRGHPEFDAWVAADDSPWGRRPGGYGQTETTGMVTFALLAPDGIGGHGRASPLVQVRVVDEDGRDVGRGEVGEIVVRGTTVMAGYWNRPDESAARARGGWHHTNDLGRLEPDGTLTFVAPKGRMLKSGAENIYPVEVEQCLLAHPSVADAAVIGVPDEVWVQRVVAVVVAAPGAHVDPAALESHCRGRIAGYKVPRRWEVVDRLPRRDGQVDHDALDDRFGGGGYPGAGTRSV